MKGQTKDTLSGARKSNCIVPTASCGVACIRARTDGKRSARAIAVFGGLVGGQILARSGRRLVLHSRFCRVQIQAAIVQDSSVKQIVSYFSITQREKKLKSRRASVFTWFSQICFNNSSDIRSCAFRIGDPNSGGISVSC